jgi:hypothetical protein
MKETPYFYHDLRARAIPGALFLVVFALKLDPPATYSSWLSTYSGILEGVFSAHRFVHSFGPTLFKSAAAYHGLYFCT